MSKGADGIFKRFTTPEYKAYFKSIHFWAPISNYSIPIAGFADVNRDPALISGKMTVALCLYSIAFIRFSWKVKPRNLLLLSVHVFNETSQLIQLVRYIKYKKLGGKN